VPPCERELAGGVAVYAKPVTERRREVRNRRKWETNTAKEGRESDRVRRDPQGAVLSRQRLRKRTPAFYLAACPLVACTLRPDFGTFPECPGKALAESDYQSSGRLVCEAMLLGGVSDTL
jgi:hypothetical protein